GERTIDGEINVDITPEYASKLGAALGNLFGKGGGRIAVGYGSAPALIMLKNSLVSGIISSGCDVLDINPTTLPITRNATMFYSCSAGIYLAGVGVAVPGAPSKIVAHILDGNGLDCLPSRERALEQLFVRNDFARINPQNLGKITEIKDYNMFYIHQIKGQADMDINITSAEPVVANVGKTVLQNMGVNIYNIISSRNIGFEIDEAGEIATIIDEKSKKLTEYEKFYLMIDILGQTENKIVLPLSAPMALRNKARQMGFKIIDSKTSDADMLHTLHKNGLTYQYGLMFDGVFLTSQVCQYFSRTGRKLTDYIKKIPPVYVASKEIEVPISIKGEIVQKLSRQEKEADLTQGVKIDKGNSWVMVVPHKKRASVVITAEGADMEAAEELIAEYGDKIF
ncbi:MAG: hypothetical protein FWE47_03300, partial [Oscillospiraceae bacterium]|nr:hypothetical protein [Oscillospiraceae bacterium]